MRQKNLLFIITFFFLLFFGQTVFAQNHLFQIISANIQNQRLEDALSTISRKGNFYFSYSSNYIPKDSIVSISVNNYTVKEVLDILLSEKYEYKETNGYIILRPAPYHLKLTPDKITAKRNWYTITGFITDERTGAKVAKASVYEKRLLESTLTDNKGYFKLKLKRKESEIALTVSKELYRDVTVIILPATLISPGSGSDLDYDPENDPGRVESTAIGRLFISSKQKIQSINLAGLFAKAPFQASLTPGISTNGIFNSQVVSKFSVNLVGGYSTGVKGVELAAGFNINKKDVKYIQAAGIFNVVGGDVEGAQFAGIMNTVMDSVEGCEAAGIYNHVLGNLAGVQLAGVVNADQQNIKGTQAAGVFNMVRGKTDGAQFAGVGNMVGDSLIGFQAAGTFNFVKGNIEGVQAAGALNIASERVDGGQISGAFNFTKGNIDGFQIAGAANIGAENIKGVQISGSANICRGTMEGTQITSLWNSADTLKGTQIGIINKARSSSGVSVGFLNLINDGYHKISLSFNELTNSNLSIKTGNSKLYSSISIGYNFGEAQKAYSFGFGFGHDFLFGKRVLLSVELVSHQVYTGSWENLNYVTRLKTPVSVKLTKGISLFAGPTLNANFNGNRVAKDGYKNVENQGFFNFDYGRSVRGWLGFEAGITIF